MTTLVQDSIFSRAPQDGVRTGIFIGGKNAEDALDMVDRAKKALVPPFANHIFADPAGSFTTGAAMVAEVTRALKAKFDTGLEGKRIVIFGGAGVVAYVAAVIGALHGAKAVIVGHDGEERVSKIANTMRWRFGVEVEAVDGSTAGRPARGHRATPTSSSRPALPASRSSPPRISNPPRSCSSPPTSTPCRPPASPASTSTPSTCPCPTGRGVGIGALAVGNVKYQTESRLFRRMLESDEPLCLDFRDAYTLAVEVAG